MCEDCFAAIITVASIFWIEYLLFEPPRYGGFFFVARFEAARRDANSIVTTITMAAAKRCVRVAPEAQALFCRRRHQASRPPLAKIRPGSHVSRDCGPRRGGALTAEDPDGFGTEEEAVSRPPMGRPAF